MHKQPPFQQIFFLGCSLALFGLAGLVLLVIYTLPTLGPRWLFFFLFMVAVSGAALPVVSLLHRRFPANPPQDAGVIVRQSMWVGFYACLLAWLQLGATLLPERAVFLAIGLIITEILIGMVEQSRWKPR